MLAQFTPPEVGEEYIPRARIDDALDKLFPRRLIYIHAPAGYGKTTAIVSWLKCRGKKAVWFTLDRYSTAPAEFCTGVLRMCGVTVNKRKCVSKPLEYTLHALGQMTLFPEIIVFDDFYFYRDTFVWQTLPLFMERFPESTSFVVLSRNPMRNAGLNMDFEALGLISGDCFEFNSAEIIQLFEKFNLTLSEYIAKLLQKRTGGWAAALAAILISREGDELSELMNNYTLTAYLQSQILFAENGISLLKRCSVCDTLSQDLCAALSGSSDLWTYIINLADRTGLAASSDNGDYVLQPLLKEFLEHEFRKETSGDSLSVYRLAADWYIEKGEMLSALGIAAKSGDMRMVKEYSRYNAQGYTKSLASQARQIKSVLAGGMKHE